MSDRHYEVDSIVGRKVKGGRVYYKVHWKGYPSTDDSWESSKSLFRCKEMINEYLESQKKAVSPKSVLLSSDEDEAPSSRTRSKTATSKTRNRERTSPRPPRKPALAPASAPNAETQPQKTNPSPPVATSPQVSTTPYNLRHTVPHHRQTPAVITSPQIYSTPQDLRRHVLDQKHRHHVSLTPDVGSSCSSSLFQQSTIRRQYKSALREASSSVLLSSDEESELIPSAKPSKVLRRKQLRSATKAPVVPPLFDPKPTVETPLKPKKPTQEPKLLKIPKPVVAGRQTKPSKPAYQKPVTTAVYGPPPGWMLLGWAEYFLALVIVAIITLSLWLYQEKFQEK